MKLKLFIAVAIIEVIAVALDWKALQWATKPLLAPLLIWHVAAGLPQNRIFVGGLAAPAPRTCTCPRPASW